MATKPLAGERKESGPPLERLAILFADIAGSSALVAKAGALVVQNAVREFLLRVDQLQTAYPGRIVKTVGDGFLAVFEEAVGALAFATALQQSLSQDPIRAAGQDLALRIGLHVGPVWERQTSYGKDVFGPDVNLTARLTDFARPGEIVISEAARLDLPEDKQALPGASEEVLLKGVSGPVKISRLDLSGG